MSSYFINPIVERAVVAFLKTKEFSWCDPLMIRKGTENREAQTDEGQDSSILRPPYIVAACLSASPVLPHFRGNWDAVLELEVANSAADTTDEIHGNRASEAFGYFDDRTIIAQIIAAYPQFWAAKLVPIGSETRNEGGLFKAARSWTFISCAATAMD